MIIKVVYFFRQPAPYFHSIEELFGNIQTHLPSFIQYTNRYAPFLSKGIFRRLCNMVVSIFQQGQVNHITGHNHYIALFLRKKKTILTAHDILSLLRGSRFKRAIIKLFWFTLPLKRIRYVTVVSEFTKQEMLRHLNVIPEKIRVIHNCYSPALRYSPKTFNKEKPTIFHIGTKENKNLLRLAQALQNISCTLIVLGKLTDNQEYMLRTNNIEYQNYVNIPFAEVINLYKCSDIVAFVSTYEGFGLPIIEANIIGRVVITSNLTSMPEVSGEGALLVNPFEVSEIREGVLKLIKEDNFRELLIERGRKNAERFSPLHIAQQYANLYKEIVQ